LADRLSRETGFSITRIRTIRNGVDLSRFTGVDRTGAREVLGLGGRGLVVVTIGRLVPVKDHMTLLEALAQLHRRGTAVTAVIAGDGPLKDQLRQQAAALGLGDAVRFLGHRTDVETVLAAADVFVLSSESEGLSNTILEAMAAGLPVVATSVGGADEIIQDGVTGRLVPSGSPVKMAEALASMLGDPAVRRSMGSAGRARAEAEFSLEGMVQRYQVLYCELATLKCRPYAPHDSSPQADVKGSVV
jgi:glycosyltransferase involved in cell wall biosynthesis